MKAELRLTLERMASTRSEIVITIKSVESESWFLKRDIPVDSNEQRKYMFDVAGILSPWVQRGK